MNACNYLPVHGMGESRRVATPMEPIDSGKDSRCAPRSFKILARSRSSESSASLDHTAGPQGAEIVRLETMYNASERRGMPVETTSKTNDYICRTAPQQDRERLAIEPPALSDVVSSKLLCAESAQTVHTRWPTPALGL